MPRYPSRYSSPSSFSFGFNPLSTAIKILIGVNVLMFIATTVAPSLQLQLGLVPMWVVREKYVWQLATYMFVHAGLFHILFNMLALWMFGTELERIWGTRYFLKFYFVTGVGAAVLTVLLSLLPFQWAAILWTTPIVGASGAIYGLLLAYALYFPDRPIYMYLVFPIPAKYFVMIIGVLTFYSSMSDSSGVANATHLGGLLVGYLYLKGARFRPLEEAKYWYLRWKMIRTRKKFDVYSGGRDWDRRVH